MYLSTKTIFLAFLISFACQIPLTTFGQSQAPDVSLRFGKGLKLTAADSSMQLKVNFRVQSLFTTEGTLNSDSEWESKFLVRRARLKFGGWAVHPNLQFKAELGLSNRDQGNKREVSEVNYAPKMILDAVVKWKMHKNWTLWVGQTKLPGNRERVISSQKLQFVDRSLTNSIFNIDRETGLQLRGKFKLGDMIIKPMAAWSLGEGRNITSGNIGGYNYTGRVEFLPLGKFMKKGDYVGSDLYREAKPKVAFGVTYNLNEGSSRQKKTGRFLRDEDGNYLTFDMESFIADMVFKYNGFSVFMEYADRHCADASINHDDFSSIEKMIDADGESYYTGKGFTAQAGYLFKNNIEIAGRFTKVTPDSDYSFTETNVYTLGLSKYIRGHDLKIQTDASLIDEEGASDPTLRYRLQFEFAF